MGSCVSTLVVSATLLNIGLNSQTLTSRSITHLWDLGYGAVNTESLVAWNFPATTGLHLTVLIANSPQALLSFLFLTYNGLFTCMLLADEWSGHAKERKTLRVTSPIGQQRSTYRLQLPYKYSIPL